MRDFNRGNRSGGDRPFRSNRSGGDRSYGADRPMFQTICSKCGNSCEVPFRPTGEKPVYCRDCFRDQPSSDSRREGGNFSRPSFQRRDENRGGNDGSQNNKQLAELGMKLDRIIELLTPKTSKETTTEVSEEKPLPAKKKASKKA